MKRIKWIKDLSLEDNAGTKAFNLGILTQNFKVPNGFVILSESLNFFLEDIKVNNLNSEKAIYDFSKESIKKIMAKDFPRELENEIFIFFSKLKSPVSVRSSATLEDNPDASFAGQYDSFLNVTKDNLLESIKRVVASLFSVRSIYYRINNNLSDEEVLMSVIVQEMVKASFAGVMFTKDPLDKKHLLIEIVKGLGESLVSGKATPNTYFFDINKKQIVNKHIHFDFDETILPELSKIGVKLEELFGHPQDIEFAITKKKEIFLLQSRNITT